MLLYFSKFTLCSKRFEHYKFDAINVKVEFVTVVEKKIPRPTGKKNPQTQQTYHLGPQP